MTSKIIATGLILITFLMTTEQQVYSGRTPVAADRHHTQVQEDATVNKSPGGSLFAILCPLRYIVYMVWFSFMGIFFAVVFVADLATFFTYSLLKDYYTWFKEKTEAMFELFCASCDCA